MIPFLMAAVLPAAAPQLNHKPERNHRPGRKHSPRAAQKTCPASLYRKPPKSSSLRLRSRA